MTYRWHAWFIGALLLTGCGENGALSTQASNPAPQPLPPGAVSGSIFDGPVQGPTVTVYNVQPDGTLGEFSPTVESFPVQEPTSVLEVIANTNQYAFNLGTDSAPVVIQVTGGTDTNVVTGETAPLPSGLVLRAIVPTPTTGSVHVTPFTTFACELALAQIRAGVSPQTAITSSNAAMGSYLGLTDLLSTAPIDPSTTSTGSRDSINYGLCIAGLAQEASDRNLSMPSFLLALNNDAQDGQFDGMQYGVTVWVLSQSTSAGDPSTLQPANTSALSGSAATSQLASAVRAFETSTQNKGARASGALLNSLSASTGVLISPMPTYTSPYQIKLSIPAASLTPDFSQSPRNQASEESTIQPFSEWFNLSAYGSEEVNQTFGPTPRQYPAPTPNVPPGFTLQQWQQQRVVATAQQYLGYHYQHHHVPDWNPSFVPDWPWSEVSLGQNSAGIDCSDFSQWNYNFGLGLKLAPADVPQDAVTAVPGQNTYTEATTWDGQTVIPIQTVATGGQFTYQQLIAQLQPGDLLYIKNSLGAEGEVTHVIMWLGDLASDVQNGDTTPLILDSHDNKPPVYDSNGVIVPAGVHIRPFYENPSQAGSGDNWYFTNLSEVHRIIHP
ncbi:MAG: hypothetical protein AMXMBFR33_48300 [Candidatus Xenobia bacterium]